MSQVRRRPVAFFASMVEAHLSDDVVSARVLERHVALVTLCRPAARNSIDRKTVARLGSIVEELDADARIRVVVLTGEGSAFSSGADLKEVEAGHMDALFTEEGGFAGFVHAARNKPWIAAVNGAAVAGGFEIALACDFIVAARSSIFGLPEVRRGLLAAAGGAYRLPQRIPRAKAMELLATGGSIDAIEAERWGLVNYIVEDGDVVDSALRLATDIARNAPLAVQESLRIARGACDHHDAELRSRSWAGLKRVMAAGDFNEGTRAFLEKRLPTW